MYGVLAGGVLRVGLLVCGVVSAVSKARGRCTGLPARPCGRHKMADYLLSAADVKWLGMECPNIKLECQVDVCSHP
jgi:hypothetical protein